MSAEDLITSRELIPSTRKDWYQNDDGYVMWRVIEELEKDKPVKLVEVVTNPYHNGGGWNADADILLGKKGRHEMTLGEDLILDWAKAILEAKGIAAPDPDDKCSSCERWSGFPHADWCSTQRED